MPKPTERKTVQARMLACAQEAGWTFEPRDEAEWRRGSEGIGTCSEERRGREATGAF